MRLLFTTQYHLHLESWSRFNIGYLPLCGPFASVDSILAILGCDSTFSQLIQSDMVTAIKLFDHLQPHTRFRQPFPSLHSHMTFIAQSPQNGSQAHAIINQQFGEKLNKFELVAIARVIAEWSEVTLGRREKRYLNFVLDWFVRNWTEVSFVLPFITMIKVDGEIRPANPVC
jgi:hypothetical protein